MSSVNKPIISLIAAIGKNRELGLKNQLLVKIPEDLKRFQKLTTNHTVIMGRKTYDSIGRVLPNRTNIILTRDKNTILDHCVVCWSLDEALTKARSSEREEIFIIGGGEIYRQAIGMADKLYLTVIDQEFKADTFFPDYSDFTKTNVNAEGEFGGMKYQFLELER